MELQVKLNSRIIIRENNMEKISNITPDKILLDEFLKPFKITAYRLSKDTGIPATRVS